MKKDKKKKVEKIKETKIRSEQEEEIIGFIKVLLLVVIIVLLVYIFTRIFITKDLLNESTSEDKAIAGEVNYNITIIGQMFNRPEDDYYVMIYDSTTNQAMYYSSIITQYKATTDATKIYFVDLNNKVFNSKYYTEDESDININTTDLNKFRVGKETLLKIKKGQIIKTFNTEESITKELSSEK